MGSKFGIAILPLWFTVIAAPVAAAPIDLSQLCGASNCVVSTSQTIGSASGPLDVEGDFTVDPGVVLQFLVPVTISVDGNMVLSGTVGAPGNGGVGGHGGDGGSGGASGQPGGTGGDAPSVVSAIFNVVGSITLDANAVAVAEGGTGGSGGQGAFGQVGGAGGVGGAAGSFTLNTCNSFTSDATAQILVNGGPGGVGQTGASGGAGGPAGTVAINAKQDIVSNASVLALGGGGGIGGARDGDDGASGLIALTASGTITVDTGTLNSGANTPVISPNQASVPALAFCPGAAPTPAVPIPTLSEWGLILLISLLAMSGIYHSHQRLGARWKSGSSISTEAPE